MQHTTDSPVSERESECERESRKSVIRHRQVRKGKVNIGKEEERKRKRGLNSLSLSPYLSL
jgi:hypothetical protein